MGSGNFILDAIQRTLNEIHKKTHRCHRWVLNVVKKVLDREHGLIEWRPLFLDALFFDLPKLYVGNLELPDHRLLRFGHTHRGQILHGDQGGKDFFTLLQGQALGTHIELLGGPHVHVFSPRCAECVRSETETGTADGNSGSTGGVDRRSATIAGGIEGQTRPPDARNRRPPSEVEPPTLDGTPFLSSLQYTYPV
jgi:hypothetical protein